MAARLGPLKVFEYVIPKLEDKNPSFKQGYWVVELLGNNCYREDDTTPLHIAAEYGNLKICKFIMNHINEKNPPNDEGVTPLHLAAENGHLNVCEYIMMHIEEKNPADIYGVRDHS